MRVDIQEAKTDLSQLVELAAKGEEIIIAKAGKAVAVLKPYTVRRKKRKPGALRGKPLDMAHFDEADSEIEELFGS